MIQVDARCTMFVPLVLVLLLLFSIWDVVSTFIWIVRRSRMFRCCCRHFNIRLKPVYHVIFAETFSQIHFFFSYFRVRRVQRKVYTVCMMHELWFVIYFVNEWTWFNAWVDDIYERAHTHTLDQLEIVGIRKHFAAKMISSLFMFYLSLALICEHENLFNRWLGITMLFKSVAASIPDHDNWYHTIFNALELAHIAKKFTDSIFNFEIKWMIIDIIRLENCIRQRIAVYILYSLPQQHCMLRCRACGAACDAVCHPSPKAQAKQPACVPVYSYTKQNVLLSLRLLRMRLEYQLMLWNQLSSMSVLIP